ncbi:hypothetical protein B0T14DRAFT_57401 [Immersiella caudata]|uniref:Uncharacterized protein n=1 Tax=Immersiella caudata TaxID=314043 RepID=A0AA39XGI3_9PEZI|nr:hypothetical protein B0T14DRAFT_57401 [Immersiella caudata]
MIFFCLGTHILSWSRLADGLLTDPENRPRGVGANARREADGETGRSYPACQCGGFSSLHETAAPICPAARPYLSGEGNSTSNVLFLVGGDGGFCLGSVKALAVRGTLGSPCEDLRKGLYVPSNGTMDVICWGLSHMLGSPLTNMQGILSAAPMGSHLLIPPPPPFASSNPTTPRTTDTAAHCLSLSSLGRSPFEPAC